MMFTQCWNFHAYTTPADHPVYEDALNFVFADTLEEGSIYPLRVSEIAEAQNTDDNLKKLTKLDKYKINLVDDTEILCKNGKLVIPKSLQQHAVEWYHHCLQHPGATRLEETSRGSMYWKGMQCIIRAYVQNCKKCQVNKKCQKQFGKLPTKMVITINNQTVVRCPSDLTRFCGL